MKLRGFGDILGFKQSGVKNFKLADPIQNSDLFELAEKECSLYGSSKAMWNLNLFLVSSPF